MKVLSKTTKILSIGLPLRFFPGSQTAQLRVSCVGLKRLVNHRKLLSACLLPIADVRHLTFDLSTIQKVGSHRLLISSRCDVAFFPKIEFKACSPEPMTKKIRQVPDCL